MTRRDMIWRGAGAAMIAAGYSLATATSSDGTGLSSLLTLIGFAAAFLGLVLLVQGKRVPLAFRIERSSHRDLPALIRLQRRRRNARR